MVGRPHNFEEMTRCKVVQNHVFYRATRAETSLPPVREHVFNETIYWTHVSNWGIAYMTVPAFFTDGWCVWFGTAIFWCCDAGDPRVSSLKEAMHSTDILLN